MTTNVEFYRGLRKHLPDEAAKMIAEALPLAEQVATKADLDLLEERLSRKVSDEVATLLRYMLAFFAPLWLGLAGMIVAIVLKG